jgi:tetratricopeptide (TPR) repeat protein
MFSQLFSILVTIAFLFVVLRWWYIADMRSILKSSQLRQRLSMEGRWKDLEDYFKDAERPRRPFVRLYRKYLMPGSMETQYALFLFKKGRLEESLAKVDQAVVRIRNKPRVFRSYYKKTTANILRGSLRTRILVLGGLGRYDDARATAAELQRLTGPSAKQPSALALLEYNCGHIDEALALALQADAEDMQYDTMRQIVANAYCMKGQHELAIQALSFEPANAEKLYSPAGLETLSKIPEGAELIALKRKKLAGIFPPARWIMLARVYIAMGNFEKALQMLDEAEKSLGSEPALQLSCCRNRARCLAGMGKGEEAERYLERMRAMARETPKRSTMWESHFAAGRAYLSLGRFDEALGELLSSHEFVLHPIQKHSEAYWIAQAHEGLGNKSEAAAHYQAVVADGIPTWMRERAVEALARVGP